MFDVTCLDSYGNVVTNLTQWDTNQSLIIADSGLDFAPEFHFCNKNSTEALVVASTIDKGKIIVEIPNILLQEGTTIIAYIYAYTSDLGSGKTLATIRIPVRPRPKPSEYEYVQNIDKVTAVALVTKLSEDNEAFKEEIKSITTELEKNYQETIDSITSRVSDGTPKGVFADASELTGLESGIYLNTTDGWIYFWDGTILSERICQYQLSEVYQTISYEEIDSCYKPGIYYVSADDAKVGWLFVTEYSQEYTDGHETYTGISTGQVYCGQDGHWKCRTAADGNWLAWEDIGTGGSSSGGAVSSVNGYTGDVNLSLEDINNNITADDSGFTYSGTGVDFWMNLIGFSFSTQSYNGLSLNNDGLVYSGSPFTNDDIILNQKSWVDENDQSQGTVTTTHKLSEKADKATTLAGYGIEDAYTKDEITTYLNYKANYTDVYNIQYNLLPEKADKPSVLKWDTAGKPDFVLEDNQEAYFSNDEMVLLTITMPNEISDYYHSNFCFKSGETPTELTYSATPIIWVGDDCDSDSAFIPEANTRYEVCVKKVGNDIVARVGAY